MKPEVLEKKLGNSKSNSKSRNSNLELLRIISMLLIVAYHLRRNGYTNLDKPLIMYLSSTVMSIWGILGVDLFLIISAWFLVSQKFKIKRIIHIVFQIFTWVMFYMIIYIIYDHFWLHHRTLSTMYSLIVYTYSEFFKPLWSSCYWFITSYFFMLLSSTLLNKILDNLEQLQLKKILLIFLFVPIYSQFSTSTVGDIVYFLYVYLLIGYIKKYGSKIFEKYTKLGFCILGITIVTVSHFIKSFIIWKFATYSRFFNMVSTFINATFGATGRNSMIILLLAMLIFFTVMKKKPTHNRIINRIASCSLGIYLFHESFLFGFPNVTNKLATKLNDAGFMSANMLFPLKYIGVVLILFTIGFILEFIRDCLLQKPFMKWVSNKYSDRITKIDKWFNKF